MLSGEALWCVLEASSTTHITPFPDTAARIVDLETGRQECRAGEIGELIVQGPQIMQGYWNNPELTAIGRPDPVKGQTIIAVIALQEGMSATRQEFLKYCKENMPDYRVPRTILFRPDIPRDPAGKMLKRLLRQEA